MLEDLRAHGLSCAPHVLAGIVDELSDDTDAVRALVGALSKEQRRGLRPLPSAAGAVAHAPGEAGEDARFGAGLSALGAGCMAEARGRLGALCADGSARFRVRTLPGLLIAHTHLEGAVPELDPSAFHPAADDAGGWRAWTHAAALGAVLCAERGDRTGMRTWLDSFHAGCLRTGAGREHRDAVVALAWLLAGERDLDVAVGGSGSLTATVLRGLRSAVHGDVDGGLQILRAYPGIDDQRDPLLPGFEGSPVARAYRVVAKSLLMTWRGDIDVARERLQDAALELPLTVPFAGLGVVLSRRLDLAVRGELGPISLALTEALPGTRVDGLVDRAVAEYLSGSFSEAATCVRLWADRGRPQPGLGVPGLDEVTPAEGRDRIVEPPEATTTRRLLRRIALAPAGAPRAGQAEIGEQVRALRSPIARARGEAMLGVRALIHDEREVGRTHLRIARSLFETSGADAWARSVSARLARLDADPSASYTGTLSACRGVWERVLTPRELEVAMLAVDGATNRDIADALTVSIRTVEVHLGRVFAKLQLRGRVELTVLAHRTNRYR